MVSYHFAVDTNLFYCQNVITLCAVKLMKRIMLKSRKLHVNDFASIIYAIWLDGAQWLLFLRLQKVFRANLLPPASEYAIDEIDIKYKNCQHDVNAVNAA